jgi:phosphoribosylformylglycinamidine synthase
VDLSPRTEEGAEPLALPARLDALLFGESQARVVISVPAHQVGRVLGQAKILGIPAAKLGQVGGQELKIKTAQGEFAWPVAELYDRWWNAIARRMAGEAERQPASTPA